MQEVSLYNETLDKKDYTHTPLPKGEYENCTFSNCDFSGSSLAGSKFIECIFNSCNLSLARLNKTIVRDVQFKDCKMLGLRFDTCGGLSLLFSFDNCQLNHSSFYNTKVAQTVFKNCRLNEVDFTSANLSDAVFDNCNLLSATFDSTILERADFRTAYNYIINPQANNIRKASFSLSGVPGLLHEFDIEIE